MSYTVGFDLELERQQREDMARQARQREERQRELRERFRGIALGLGEQGLAELASNRQVLDEAITLAADEWNRLAQLEQQVIRERGRAATLAARLASTPAIKTPATMVELQKSDEWRALATNVERSKAGVAALEAEAKQKRAELESYRKGK